MRAIARPGREGLRLAIELAAIQEADIDEVSAFMHENLNDSVSQTAWARALRVPWKVDSPNHGFLLRDEERVVGAYLAYYSTRPVGGEILSLCNLGAWCVLEPYRSHGIRLLRALLSQKGYHFTDLSPSGNVVALNRRLRFEDLDTATALMPNLPWPRVPGHVQVTCDSRRIEFSLAGRDLEIFVDHRTAAAAIHLLITTGTATAYVIVRRDRRKGLPLFASLLYTSDPMLTARFAHVLGEHLLVHHGVAATLLERRLLGQLPRGSFLMATSRPKMFKSAILHPTQVDYLYSELTCLPW
jgi:hypothetical protein